MIRKPGLSVLRRYLRDRAGGITLSTVLMAIPVVASAGMAIDYVRAIRSTAYLQEAADGATLAAAAAKKLSGTAKEQQAARYLIASKYLTRSLAEADDAALTAAPGIVVDGDSVKVTIQAKVNASFINVLNALPDNSRKGGRSTSITVRSKARYLPGKTEVCLLALNPSAADSLYLQGTADITANNCAVHVNSTSNSALRETGTATLKAIAICTGGNYVGSAYTPMPRTSCAPLADPYATIFATDFAKAYGAAATRSKARLQLNAGTNTLSPGIYTGGIRASNGNIGALQPGAYFIKDGALEIRAGGSITGTGVTIVLMGSSAATLEIQGGGSINIKAPATGSFAGIAIAQHPSSIPTKTSTITGGGTIEMEGIVYFPKQTLAIAGNGDISLKAKQFSIVADRISVQGTGQLKIGQAADHDAAGLPPLLSTISGAGTVSLVQ